jgi:hypothetical protein
MAISDSGSHGAPEFAATLSKAIQLPRPSIPLKKAEQTSENEGKNKESPRSRRSSLSEAMCFGFGVVGIPIHFEEI